MYNEIKPKTKKSMKTSSKKSYKEKNAAAIVRLNTFGAQLATHLQQTLRENLKTMKRLEGNIEEMNERIDAFVQFKKDINEPSNK